jgi:hypothetical protein
VAVRPAASSGHPDKKSAIELRYVRYKGKLVLWRGHVPILNVRYNNDVCGPHRDWQDAETCFTANLGADVPGTGFRLSDGPAMTLYDTPSNDCGNLRGVAIWIDGQKVILESELTAGWYRYIPRWTLHSNGRIDAQFAFAATKNACTCQTHHHHAYFRLDFDVVEHGNNAVEEYENSGGSYSLKKTITTEERRVRGASDLKWRIQHSGGKYYDLVPGPDDLPAVDTDIGFAKGDLWVLPYHADELEDGVSCVSCSVAEAAIQIDGFDNNESVSNQNLVVWYGGHFIHAIGEGGEAVEITGPSLIPSPGFGNCARLRLTIARASRPAPAAGGAGKSSRCGGIGRSSFRGRRKRGPGWGRPSARSSCRAG